MAVKVVSPVLPARKTDNDKRERVWDRDKDKRESKRKPNSNSKENGKGEKIDVVG